jgi:diguanylate cyclase (GGDEF)-like protein
MRLTTASLRKQRSAPDEGGLSQAWVAVLVGVLLVFTYVLDRNTDAAPVQHLYYLPIIIAASRLRRGGGVVTSIVAIVLYHLANSALLTFAYRETDLVQIALFIAVGVVTASLTENARRLHALAMTDDLTGLHNLRSFETRLIAMIHAARERGASVWMLVFDLDRLKSLNDTYGHLTGAQAVRHVGQLAGARLPVDAVACRYGGDEFVVCVSDRTDAEAQAIADTLCTAVSDSAPVLAGKSFPRGTLSISVGVARGSWAGAEAIDGLTDAKAGEVLFRAADAALYAAKARGRNQVFVSHNPAEPLRAVQGDARAWKG